MYRDNTKKIFNQKKLQEISEKCSLLNLDTLYEKSSNKSNPCSLIARSDNFPFMQKGIPAIWFLVGSIQIIIQPTDTW